MPKDIVINTGPLIAIVAATENLNILKGLYNRIIVPFEVGNEILDGGPSGFGVQEFHDAAWLDKLTSPSKIGAFLHNMLDPGEASVIQIAIDRGISTVCIDEAAGRRIARLNGLRVTGSIGILIRAKKEGANISIRVMLENMRNHGVWLSQAVIDTALKESAE